MMSARELTFRGGSRTAALFVVAFPLLLLLVGLPVRASAFVAALPTRATVLVEQVHFVALAAFTLLVLRREGMAATSLGLSAGHLRAGVVAFALVWTALNLLGIGLAEATGNEWGLDVLRKTLPEPVVIGVLVQFFVVGPVEEFTIRGYLQTKLIALYGDRDRRDVALGLGILSASLFFGLVHVPQAVLSGSSPGQIAVVVIALTASGVFFGLLYELTQNLYFVGWLHGLGNTWILVVDWWAWSGVAFVGFLVGVLIVYAAATLVYRARAIGTDVTPVVRRIEAG